MLEIIDKMSKQYLKKKEIFNKVSCDIIVDELQILEKSLDDFKSGDISVQHGLGFCRQ
ncbi:hypothetical protein AB837_00521 [bacterium AB1]|nr:hypothetical protein AB837_00521 [bacterium AB1]